MGKIWTEAQKEAVFTRDKNILVSAAAGAGKTAVLIERLVQLMLENHIGIDQILMVTFTNAAAGEMRSRIYDRLQEVLESAQPDEIVWLRRQLRFVGAASISTIHAFCMDVVRQYSFLIQLDPNFRIGDTTEMDLMRDEVVQDVLEEEYEKEKADFLQLADLFATPRSDQKLRDFILKIYDFIQNQPEPFQWLQEKVDAFVLAVDGLDENHPMIQKQRRQIEMLLEGAGHYLQKAVQITQMDAVLSEKYLPVLFQEQAVLENLREQAEHDFKQCIQSCQNISFARLPNAPKQADIQIKKLAQQFRKQEKDCLLEIGQWIENYFENLEDMRPAVQALQRVLHSFQNLYQEQKQEHGILDFNDLEHEALKILRMPEPAKAYQERFAEIFIDEYQDSNRVQEEILRCISCKNHLFMVGDVKQSIYRFRSADPDLFRYYYDTYKEHGDLPEVSGKVIDMQHNFRSTQSILCAVNDIFKHIMKKQTGEIDYNERAEFFWGENQIEGKPAELLLMESSAFKSNDAEGLRQETEGLLEEDILLEELERMNSIELEASMIAQKIKGLMQEKILENGTERPVRYHDIVILMRSLVSSADTMAQVLAENGIPVYTSQGKGYFDVIEVTMFLDLLRLLDNKLQDLPLLSVLRSPIGNFSLQDLMQIRIQFPEGPYQKAMQSYVDCQQDDLACRLRSFIQQCKKWQDDSRLMPLADFIWKLFRETGYYEYVGAMPGGKQRQLNLRLLLEKAEIFQGQPQQGLFRFLQYIEKVQKNKSRDDAAAGLLSENDDVVRLMSVHKSKGLEFPIVILAGLGKKMNFRDTQSRILLHKELGIGMQYVDAEKHFYCSTLPREIIAHTIRMEQMAEEMRVFYVACTRAKHRLIFTAALRNLIQAAKRWNMGCGIYEISHASSWIDWVGMVLMKHPDGEILRRLDEDTMMMEEDFLWTSRWNIFLYDRQGFFEELQQKKMQAEQRKQSMQNKFQGFSAQKDSQMIPEIYQKLVWEYPYPAAVQIPSKITVTQMKQMQRIRRGEETDNHLEELSLEEPVFITHETLENKMDARRRGTLVHQFLRHVDFSHAATVQDLKKQLQVFQERKLFTEEESRAVYLQTIVNLVQSPLGKRIQQSAHIYRETPFNYMIPAEEVFPDYFQEGDMHTQEKMMLQGIIDLYFEEDDSLVLVDYKTDFAGQLQEAEAVLTERYALQVDLYRKALEKLTHRKVKTAGLYLLNYGKFLEILPQKQER